MQIINLQQAHHQKAISQAVTALQSGQLVIYPTETCYGLGVDATNQKAVDRLLKFKTRREGKAFSVAVTDQKMAEEYVTLNQTARQLYSEFLPGPLTVVSKVRNKISLAKGVCSEFMTLGIRIPDHPIALSLVKVLGKPITATSANVSYQSPPYGLGQWLVQTPKKSQKLVDLWLDAGDLPHRHPSTVIDTSVEALTVLRQGTLQFNVKLEAVSLSEEDTHKLAQQLINNHFPEILESGLIIGLQGPLGAGKTQFAKGAAQALGITDLVRSPTFTLMHEYKFKLKTQNSKLKTGTFYHLDAWRLESEKEFSNLGLDRMVRPGSLFIVEWVEKVKHEVEDMAQTAGAKLLWGNCDIVNEHTRRWTFSALQ